LDSHLHVQAHAGGMHVLAHLRGRRSDKRAASAAQAHGLAVQALSHWRINTAPQGGLLMGFTNIVGPDMAMQLARRLKEAIA